MFKCGYCGKEYDSLPERAKCELRCDEAQAREAEAARKKRLQEQKEERLSEIKKVHANLMELCEEFERDYQTEIWLGDLWPEIKFLTMF